MIFQDFHVIKTLKKFPSLVFKLILTQCFKEVFTNEMGKFEQTKANHTLILSKRKRVDVNRKFNPLISYFLSFVLINKRGSALFYRFLLCF